MARIETISLEEATGDAKAFLETAREEYGGSIPGIYNILLVDPQVAGPVGAMYRHLNLRPTSSISKVQREMVATLVNGLVGGTP